MRYPIARFLTTSGFAIALLFLCSAEIARAIDTAFYPDPGWTYVYDGDEAFYGTGQNGDPVLVDPAGNDGVTEWVPRASQWDGSAPGDLLGGSIGVPDGSSIPEKQAKLASNPSPAPGGVATYTDSGTSYLRMQDPGNPFGVYGWGDKGNTNMAGTNTSSGNNRQVNFGHDITADSEFSGNSNVIDTGITISFRTRIATDAVHPLDRYFVENGSNTGDTLDWPATGVGYPVANTGRGLFSIGQIRDGTGEQLGFGLINQNTITDDGQGALPITKTGLVMNNPFIAAVGGDVDTNKATDATVNIVEIDSADLNDWQEFLITVEAINLVDGVPQPNADNNTHEVNIYYAGSDTPLEPETFEIVLGSENQFTEIGISTFISMGLSSATRRGAVDVDFFAYKEGTNLIVEPPDLNADFDGDGDIDGADFLIWQRGFGNGATFAEGDANIDGVVDEADLAIWKTQYLSGPPLSGLAIVPEPATIGLLLVGGLVLACLGSRKKQ